MSLESNKCPVFNFIRTNQEKSSGLGPQPGEFNGFEWTGATVDWDKQDHYRDLVYEDLAVPIIDYLKKRGYFGLVTFEVLFTDHGKYLQWNSDFSNLQGKWKLVRKIGSSKNRRWHQITPVLRWNCFIRSKKADNNGISLLLMCDPSLFTNKTYI